MSRRSSRRSLSLDQKSRSKISSEVLESRSSTNATASGIDVSVEEDEDEELEGGGNVDRADEGEEEEEEEEEITRCICGQDELSQDRINPALAHLLKKEFKIDIDQGLFIQCDKCSVWQHGYCVGLYENDDVPDKYWCEQCKPELHIIVDYDTYSDRTLYKPVNDKRKKIEQFGIRQQANHSNEIKSEATDVSKSSNGNNNNNNNNNNNKNNNNNNKNNKDTENINANTNDSSRGNINSTNNQSTSTSSSASTSGKRKRNERGLSNASKERRTDRRYHYQRDDADEYDKQLQKALRESAKESGLVAEESETGRSSPRKRSSRNTQDSITSASRNSLGSYSDGENTRSKRFKTENAAAELHSDGSESQANSTDLSRSKYNRSKKRSERGNGRAHSASASASASSSTTSVASAAEKYGKRSAKKMDSNDLVASNATAKEEIVKQPFKPRYVSGNSSFYDLRKRTSAIIEWIVRTHHDLLEEKAQKLELFSFAPDSEVVREEKTALERSFDENSAKIENLRTKINEWESKFGKYAAS
ncbi:Histone deacetylase complex subunit [Lodderomyces elongisporus]|uniref:Histone deacetylase complex subunit n=1 Tax=Lodderomyces elongisporus TaxID=36914 RepID=UPI0029254D9C|nr:Histone deacetylase complex subunit [Lodderomyces elongisporus]WLF81809.1 Histone deacetylase complex subunit [Lodderomyces elongisporus]